MSKPRRVTLNSIALSRNFIQSALASVLLVGLIAAITCVVTERLQALTTLSADLREATSPHQPWQTPVAITADALASASPQRIYLPGPPDASDGFSYTLSDAADFTRTEHLLQKLDHLPASLDRVREMAASMPAVGAQTEQERAYWLLSEHVASLPTQQQLPELVARYRRYQFALDQVSAHQHPSTPAIDARTLRSEFFTAAQISHLFAGEDARQDYLLKRRRVLERKDLSAEEKAKALEALERERP